MKKLIVISLLLALVAVAAMYAEDSSQPESLLTRNKQIPDITTFMKIGACRPAAYSWDGKSVYFTSSASGSAQVYRINKEGWPYQLTAFQDGIDFFSLSWGGELGIVGASVGGSEDAQLYLMDTKTGETYQLTNAKRIRYGAVVWARDDKSIFYRSNEENGQDFFIYRMDIATGASEKIFGDTTGVRGYITIADINQIGNKLLLLNYTSNVANSMYLLDLDTGDYMKLTDDDGDVYYGSPTILPGDDTIFLVCNGNKDGITRLARMKIGSPDVRFIDDGWIDPKWEIESLVFSRDYRYMAAQVNEDGYFRVRFREAESLEPLPSPPLEGMFGAPIFDTNGSCILSFQGPTRVNDVWRWDPRTKELKQLTFSTYCGIDRELFSDPELVKYKSFDSLEIPAFIYLPPNYQKGTPIPFLVDAHGGPEGQFQPDFIRNFQYLILHGYGVFAPNPRGSSGYGKEYIAMDDYKNRKNSLKDYKAGVDWLIKNGYTKKGMIGIRGGSYGGYVVLGMITEYPDLFSAAIDVVGIANFKTFLENTRAYRRALRESEYGPLSDPAFLEEISPINKANLIKTPLFVIHGENDPRVPVGEARQILKAVADNGGQVDSLIFPDEGHGIAKTNNSVISYRRQIEFLNKYLKGMSN